jgi:hypothetical protein
VASVAAESQLLAGSATRLLARCTSVHAVTCRGRFAPTAGVLVLLLRCCFGC